MCDAALQALGCLGIARPRALLCERARAAMRATLDLHAPSPLKVRAVTTLADMLKVCPAQCSPHHDLQRRTQCTWPAVLCEQHNSHFMQESSQRYTL